ncbi:MULTISPECIES: thioredoxin domain-containing protein [unclassified Sphingomonas]|uniref:DsbA family protein n=1 Tax=Novosphingobium rhizosphaerae TaxID=1551649 RepID=UPI0015CDB081
MRAWFRAMALAATITVSAMGPMAAQALAAPAQLPDIPAPWRTVPDVGALLAQDRVSGPVQAPVSVVVWSDPECPYCKQFSGVPDAAISRAKGQANLAIRMLPLPFHGAAAVLGGMAALCVADQGGSAAYYRFLGDYFARTGGNGRGLPGNSTDRGRGAVVALARQDGAADAAKLDACLRSDDTLGRLAAEGDAAERATVQGTPAVAVRNNTTGETILVDGAIDGETLDAAIALMAARSTRHGPPPADYSR